MMDGSKLKVQKPSCPKEFFAKLYGHLDEERENVKEKETTFEFIANSGKNNNITNIQVLNEVRRCGKGASIYTSPDITRNPPFTLLSSTISSDISNFCSETAVTAGVTAFLARRRRKEGRPRRQRTTFSSDQTLSLELEYHRSEYISRGRRFELAQALHLTEAQIKIWFQNRRAKDKRIEKAQIDQQYRNLLLNSGITGLTIPQSKINFCGICIYRNKLSSPPCKDSESH